MRDKGVKRRVGRNWNPKRDDTQTLLYPANLVTRFAYSSFLVISVAS
jgi:hypothetical protein